MNIKIIPHRFNEVELSFIDDFYSFLKKYPFKMFDILKVLNNTEITFKRDTTLIITITKLSKLMFKDLLSLFDELCKNSAISKIIFQKEFLIIHLYNEFITNVLTNKTMYMYIDYYYTLLKQNYEVFLLPSIVINEACEEVTLVFKNNELFYIFKIDKIIVPYKTYYIDLYENYYEFKNRLFLKYYLSDNMKEIELCKIIDGHNSFN